jgi:hypothetical protein
MIPQMTAEAKVPIPDAIAVSPEPERVVATPSAIRSRTPQRKSFSIRLRERKVQTPAPAC